MHMNTFLLSNFTVVGINLKRVRRKKKRKEFEIKWNNLKLNCTNRQTSNKKKKDIYGSCLDTKIKA